MSGGRRALAAVAALVLLLGGALAAVLAGRTGETAALRRVARLSRVLEAMRGRTFRREVALGTQTPEEFRRFVDREIDRELPPEKARAVSRSLQAFGLLPKGYDLRKGLSDLYVSQAGAYYDPASRRFYLLMAEMPEEQLDAMIVHELTHALQDQYHDLAATMRALATAGDDDATSAFQSLVEGEATLAMTRFELRQKGMEGMLDVAVAQMRRADRATLLRQASEAEGRLGKGSEEVRSAVAALKTLPGYLFWSLHAPYFRGQYAVFRVQAGGGWRAVDDLYDRPPSSTAQILHPERLIAPTASRADPVTLPVDAIAAALGAGWKLLHSNVLGELGVFILFDERLPPEPPDPIVSVDGEPQTRRARIAAGWSGDRYATFERAATGDVALVWKTCWDTDEDARELTDGLAQIGLHEDTVRRGRAVLVLRGVPREARAAVIAELEK